MNSSYLEYVKKYLPADRLDEGLKLLEKGVSPQYIVGNVDFYGNIIYVDERVLIPRFETELLVEKTISYINKMFYGKVRILDIGTGSGCIAIALKKELDCDMVACDISNEALDVSILNANYNKVDIKFVSSDIFSNVNDKFDVIVSNPPYIKYDEEIEVIVKDNEPSLALYADNDGLYFYDKILKECSGYLSDNFLIAFEIGYTQGERIINFVYKYLGKDIHVKLERDYSDKDRFLFIWN